MMRVHADTRELDFHCNSQQAGHERNINCSYTWFFRRQRFPHHFTVKSKVLQEYFRMIRLFPISLDCRISNKGLFGCCKRWSLAVGKRNERYQVSPKRERVTSFRKAIYSHFVFKRDTMTLIILA